MGQAVGRTLNNQYCEVRKQTKMQPQFQESSQFVSILA